MWDLGQLKFAYCNRIGCHPGTQMKREWLLVKSWSGASGYCSHSDQIIGRMIRKSWLLTHNRGRFNSRRSDSFCRSNSFLPEMTNDYWTCFRVGHFGGQMQKVWWHFRAQVQFLLMKSDWEMTTKMAGYFAVIFECTMLPKSIWPGVVFDRRLLNLPLAKSWKDLLSVAL